MRPLPKLVYPPVPAPAPVRRPSRTRRQALLGELAGWRTAATLVAASLSVLIVFAPAPPLAQLGLRPADSAGEPVTFTADELEYDQAAETVTARGKVEAWQAGRLLRAERVTYNRLTDVALAEGNVVLVEADGQVLFAERAELTGGMRDAVLEGVQALLAGNARMAGSGARRTGGDITDIARVVYSPCDLCADNPQRPPLWQLRARIASLHSTEQRVRYRDAAVQIAGVPLFYTPYLSHASPDAARATGFLSPTFGNSRILGLFTELPFYWAIDDHSDARITPTVSASQVPQLGATYRRRFNAGELSVEGSVGSLSGNQTDNDGLGGHIDARALFSLDENWRAGFTLSRASSRDYLRAYRYAAPYFLSSGAYLEGFWGTEGYARLETRFYQALSVLGDTSTIPFVLPAASGDYAFAPDRWGGSLTIDGAAYSIFRGTGTDTRRTGARARYELPMLGPNGEVVTVRNELDVMAGWVDGLSASPSFGDAAADGLWHRAHIRSAVDWRLPLVREAGDWGAHLIEPRIQLVTGPQTGAQARFPNEDSLDLEFTDATLFRLNRFAGRDRLEGGTRVDAALRSAWLFPNGGQLEALAGRSYRLHEDQTFPTGSGLEKNASDWVGRLRVAPAPWLELLGRTRLDGENFEPRLWETSVALTGARSRFSLGYLSTDPAPLTETPKREEVAVGGGFQLDQYWRVSASNRYDIARDRASGYSVALTYEDECLVFDTRFARSRAIDPSTQREIASGTLLLFRVTLKTIGDLGVRAL